MAGTLIGVIISGFLLIRAVQYKIIFAIGFLILAIDCVWFTYVFYPDASITSMGAPLFLQGFGQGWLFTPIVMYMSGNLPANLAANASLLGTATRFWTTNIAFSLVQTASFNLNWKHFTNLSAALNEVNPIVNEAYQAIISQNNLANSSDMTLSLANGKLASRVIAQSTLLSNMEIFTALAILAFCTFVLILTIKPSHLLFKKIKAILFY